MASITSVNVGSVREVEWFGRRVRTGIWKEPVEGRVPLAGVNLAGDDQADRRVHGGPDKAVYAYAAEDYAWWQQELATALPPGTFGENLTVEGLDLAALSVGDAWVVGAVRLRVTQPRFPCFKLGIRMGDAEFVGAFGAARRSGAYLAIERPGDVAAGDAVVVEPTTGPVLTIGDFVDAHEDGTPALLRRIAEHPAVPDDWRADARRRLARASG